MEVNSRKKLTVEERGKPTKNVKMVPYLSMKSSEFPQRIKVKEDMEFNLALLSNSSTKAIVQT